MGVEWEGMMSKSEKFCLMFMLLAGLGLVHSSIQQDVVWASGFLFLFMVIGLCFVAMD